MAKKKESWRSGTSKVYAGRIERINAELLVGNLKLQSVFLDDPKQRNAFVQGYISAWVALSSDRGADEAQFEKDLCGS